MTNVKHFDNLILKRKQSIVEIITEVLLKDIAKLVSEYDYHLHGTSYVFGRHRDSVESIIALPDGPSNCSIERVERIVSGSLDKTIKIQDPYIYANDFIFNTSNNTIINHINQIWCLAALSNERIICGTYDKLLKIWNVQTGECEATIKAHNNSVFCVAMIMLKQYPTSVLPDSPHRIVSGSYDKTLKIWNTQNWNCDHILSGHTDEVYCVTTFPNGRIVSGSRNGTLKIWNSSTGNCENTFTGHPRAIYCVAALPDGPFDCVTEQFVSGSGDNTLKIWDFNGDCHVTFTGHTNSVYCVAFLPDGRLVSGSADGTIKIWNLQTGNCDTTFVEYSSSVKCISVNSNGNIISGYRDGTLRIWS
jgi:WD40 repeat protein